MRFSVETENPNRKQESIHELSGSDQRGGRQYDLCGVAHIEAESDDYGIGR